VSGGAVPRRGWPRLFFLFFPLNKTYVAPLRRLRFSRRLPFLLLERFFSLRGILFQCPTDPLAVVHSHSVPTNISQLHSVSFLLVRSLSFLPPTIYFNYVLHLLRELPLLGRCSGP